MPKSLPNRCTAAVLAALVLALPALVWADPYRAVWVYDGDTIRVERNGASLKIRLVGIDAPETAKPGSGPGQPYSRKARERLAKLVLDHPVRLNRFGLDAYNRVLAEVFVAGSGNAVLNVNLTLVQEGLAAVYGGRLPDHFDATPYRKAEAEAKAALRGIWRQKEKYQSPWQWKRSHRSVPQER